MVNTVVLNYLREHRGKYNIDDLKKEIISKGYSEFEFDDALNELKKQELISQVKYKRLGETTVPKKKKGKLIAVIFSLFILIALSIVILNFLGYDFLNFNLFG